MTPDNLDDRGLIVTTSPDAPQARSRKEQIGEQAFSFLFGDFVFSPTERRLTRGGEVVTVGSRALDVLTVLIRKPGQLTSKSELALGVWGHLSITDESLRFQISMLRKALHERHDGDRFIINVSGQGYTFVAPVRRLKLAPAALEWLSTAPFVGLPGPDGSIGRDDIATNVQARLVDRRLVTLVGPGGVGKTNVARTVAGLLRPPGIRQAAWIDLSSATDKTVAATTIGTALGIADTGDQLLSAVSSTLSGVPMLLVFDCCERAVFGIAEIVEAIRAAAPETLILCTSREPLHIAGEQVLRLPSLPLPSASDDLAAVLDAPSARLLFERASGVGAADRFERSDAASLTTRLCTQLDGMPLAIELAAAQLVAFDLDQLSSLLASRIPLRAGGNRTAAPRHQTIEATLDWSFNLLSVNERKVLGRLSVFEGDFTLEALIDVVCDSDLPKGEVLTTITALTDKSLLRAQRVDGSVAYRLLDMTRAHAGRQLMSAEELAAVSKRHAMYVEACASAAQIEGAEASASAWLRGACPNVSNLRTALTWALGEDGDLTVALRLCATAAPLLMQLSLLDECERWCARALAAVSAAGEALDVVTRILAFRGAAMLATKGPVEGSLEAMRSALKAALAAEDSRCTSLAQSGLYWLWMYRGIPGAALECAEALGAVDSDAAARAVSASYTGMATTLTGRPHEAYERLAESEAMRGAATLGSYMRIGSDPGVLSRVFMVRALWLSGRIGEALDLYAKCEESLRRPEHGLYRCLGLNEIMIPFYCYLERWADAENAGDELLEAAEHQTMEARRHSGLCARTAVDLLQSRGSAFRLAAVIEPLRERHFTVLMPWLEWVLAAGFRREARRGQASNRSDASINSARQTGNLWWLPEQLRLKARLAEDLAEKMALLTTAADLARNGGATALELTSLTDFCQLAQAADAERAYARLRDCVGSLESHSFAPALQKAHAVLARH